MIAAQPSSRARRARPWKPTLENGDRLTAVEFMRRCKALPEIKKAELIEGRVHMGSPVRYSVQGAQDSMIHMCFSLYAAEAKGVRSSANTTVLLDPDNVPQPDQFLFIEQAYGGQSRIDKEGYVEGAPELIAEIAASSASIDAHEKRQAYRRNGVLEYWIWFAEEERFEFWSLSDGDYRPLEPGTDGQLHSQVFPGLWLNTLAALDLDSAAVLKTLQAGLRGRAHREFARTLAQAKRNPRK